MQQSSSAVFIHYKHTLPNNDTNKHYVTNDYFSGLQK